MNTRRWLAAGASLTLLLASCRDPGEPLAAGRVRIQLMMGAAAAGETLAIDPSYRRADRTVVALAGVDLPLDDQASRTVGADLDITECLADDRRESGGQWCPLRLHFTLRDGQGSLLDSASVGPLDATAGGSLAVPAVTLRHVESVVLTGPDTVRIGNPPAALTAEVRDRTNAAVAGRNLTWSSNNPAVASVDQAGVITAVAPGRTTIRAAVVDGPAGAQGSFDLTVVWPNSAVIGPAGGTLHSAAGDLTMTVPPGSLGTATTVSIVRFVPPDIGPRVVSDVYSIQPTGLLLQQPVTLVLSYDPARIAGGVRNEPAVRLFQADQVDSVGRVISNGPPVNHQVAAPITQFGLVAAAITVANVRSLAVGDKHSCVALTTGQAMCWGSGDFGEMGDGTGSTSWDPVLVLGTQDFTAVTAGNGFSCGVTGAGQVWCWGANALGQLGNGTTTQSNQPVAVTLPSPAVSVEATVDAVCALTQSQRVYCWGNNGQGQLGTTTAGTCGGVPCSATPLPLPAAVDGATITAGFQRFCAVSPTFQGCWGSNLGGALGVATTTAFSQTPIAPPAGTGPFVKLRSGTVHTCGVLADGTASCWGSNIRGALGDGTISGPGPYLTPRPMAGGLQFGQLDPGGPNHFPFPTQAPACGVTLAGAGYCWGANSRGQLGTTALLVPCNVGFCSGTPVPVTGGLTFREIHGGALFACGVTTAGQVFCWGADDEGQVGDGRNVDVRAPSLVQ